MNVVLYPYQDILFFDKESFQNLEWLCFAALGWQMKPVTFCVNGQHETHAAFKYHLASWVQGVLVGQHEDEGNECCLSEMICPKNKK